MIKVYYEFLNDEGDRTEVQTLYFDDQIEAKEFVKKTEAEGGFAEIIAERSKK